MSAGPFDIEVEQGVDYTLTLSSWTDTSGNPVSLVGYTARMQLRDTPGGTIYLTLTQASGITISTGAGTITITMTSAQTALFTPQKESVYDLMMTSGAGIVTRLIAGKVTIIPRVTV